MKKCSIVILTAALVAMSWFSDAMAQFVVPIAPDMAMAKLNRELLDRRLAAQGRNVQPTPEQPPKEVARDTATLQFETDDQRRAANIRSYTEGVRRVDAADAQRLEELFSAKDVMALVSQQMSSIGFDSNNLADVYAVWWIAAYQGSEGTISTQSPARYRAVRKQSEELLLSIQYLLDASDAEKQSLAETFLIKAVLIDGSVQAALGQPGQLEVVQAAVRRGALASGLDLERLVLTDEGFRPR